MCVSTLPDVVWRPQSVRAPSANHRGCRTSTRAPRAVQSLAFGIAYCTGYPVGFLPVKRHRGSRDTHGHTDHTDEPHKHPNPPERPRDDRISGRLNGRSPGSRPLPAADSEAAPCEPDPAAPRSTGGRFLPVPRPCQRQVKSGSQVTSGLPRLPTVISLSVSRDLPGSPPGCWSTFDRLDLTSTVEFVTKRARTHRTRPLGSVGKSRAPRPVGE